jgi:hypothetical protein
MQEARCGVGGLGPLKKKIPSQQKSKKKFEAG